MLETPTPPSPTAPVFVDFQTDPSRYRHWRLEVEGPIATLIADFDEEGALVPGYRLKLNSYDLGVDIELHDALNRIRFEHPTVRTVVITSGKSRVFCSGANIYMLGQSDHAWKVNFCRFTNETRNGMEDSSRHDGLKFLAAINGSCAGGGYELALACDEILLIDDRSSAVSLPEVPLLGVLPGTGGLTRLTDKRRVRPDLADLFCTTAEGVRGERAKAWRLVDDLAKPAVFAEKVRARALALAAQSSRPAAAEGIRLTPIVRTITPERLRYSTLEVRLDHARRTAEFTLTAPDGAGPESLEAILAAGAEWYPLRLARELDDAILSLRTNEPALGLWIFRSEGDAKAMLALDEILLRHRTHWFVRETIGWLRRTFARLDVTARSLFALIGPASAFAGTLLEIPLACDRAYQLALPEEPARAPCIALSEANFGLYPMITGESRLARRLVHDEEALAAARAARGRLLAAEAAFDLGLVTRTPDDLDWEDEIRIAIEERASLSPDALTGMEANLRFGPRETMESRIFGRLSAWQNWIFQRPNAVGAEGALKVYGSGRKPHFDWGRT